MRNIWSILVITWMVISLLACQPAISSGQVPEDSAQTASSASSPQSSTTQAPPPTLVTEDTDMTPATPAEEATTKMVTLVTQHLAQKLGLTADQILLSEVKPVVWRDAGLGCPKPGIDYIQVETPGFNIFLEAGGKTYNYHTDSAKRFVLCNK